MKMKLEWKIFCNISLDRRDVLYNPQVDSMNKIGPGLGLRAANEVLYGSHPITVSTDYSGDTLLD